jgi:hypothetical protein
MNHEFHGEDRYYVRPGDADSKRTLPQILIWQDTKGWWYEFSMPGCLPDGGDGPFLTGANALFEARKGFDDDDCDE